MDRQTDRQKVMYVIPLSISTFRFKPPFQQNLNMGALCYISVANNLFNMHTPILPNPRVFPHVYPICILAEIQFLKILVHIVVIDREAREIIRLIMSVCPFVCLSSPAP